MKRLALLMVVMTRATGCETIYFQHGNATTAHPTTQQQWHHDGGIFSLVEFSDPYNAKANCKDSAWQAVKVDHTFVTGLVSALVPYGIYTPWEVGVVCGTDTYTSIGGIEHDRT